MKNYTWLVILTILINQNNSGQNTVFSDNFSTNTSLNWTTVGIIGSSLWSVTRSGEDWGARISSDLELLELTNDAGGSTNANGWVFANTFTGSFSAPFNNSLNLNSGIVGWNFNLRQTREDPAGFTGGSYGVAFILAGSSQTADNEGEGYAVVVGQSGETDPIRLTRYTGGLSGSLTDIIISNTTGLTDFGTEYISLRVTYNPSDDRWELFLRNDGMSSFSDPNTGSLISQGSAADNYFVGLPLAYLGGYWHGSTSAGQTAFFDNVMVTIGNTMTEPIVSLSNSFLSGFNYTQGSGPSAEQSFLVSGRNLTHNILITPPADYEISTTSGDFFSSAPLALLQSGGSVSSTRIYVRLRSGLSAGTYDDELITASTPGASEKNIVCNGTVSTPVSPPLPMIEDFNYSAGDLLTNNGWTRHSGTADPLIISNSGLIYPGYPSSGIGNAVNVFGAGEDVNFGIEEQNINGTIIYLSFLINVPEIENNLTGGYFLHLGNRTNPTFFTAFCARIHARVDAEGNINFGLSNASNPPQWISEGFSRNTTYLLIVKYIINTSGNDEVKLWVRSSGVPPDETSAGNTAMTISTEEGQNVIDAVAIRQSNEIPDLIIDGIRIANSWANAPLPVEIASFSASVVANSVKLNWRTETEVNNYGFEVERQFGIPQSAAGKYEKIGFVEGSGNSNSPKTYSFTDDLSLATNHNLSYRLKQIDNDGKYEYSKVIEVGIGTPDKTELAQNFPNPFNPVTKISWQSPVSGHQTLKVYDILGNEVATLVDEYREAGRYEVEFQSTVHSLQPSTGSRQLTSRPGSALTSGIYFYQLQAGNKILTHKMTLLK